MQVKLIYSYEASYARKKVTNTHPTVISNSSIKDHLDIISSENEREQFIYSMTTKSLQYHQ